MFNSALYLALSHQHFHNSQSELNGSGRAGQTQTEDSQYDESQKLN